MRTKPARRQCVADMYAHARLLVGCLWLVRARAHTYTPSLTHVGFALKTACSATADLVCEKVTIDAHGGNWYPWWWFDASKYKGSADTVPKGVTSVFEKQYVYMCSPTATRHPCASDWHHLPRPRCFVHLPDHVSGVARRLIDDVDVGIWPACCTTLMPPACAYACAFIVSMNT